ncbi:multicopper oxidase family protein [Methylobacterium planeticum]|uniref:Multicopper oxidase domain-containing protein n=1 Tax=Methylobacterium planeticum TaxID=2615211 RepID=A0A6N6MTM7_9HYPH|nr:multicopper oxidase family protein [Methylobacterium planeticum]KAB1072050.1 multicopper oxidase domain-containing protein [Methylobacterium planeticum]
MQQAPQEIAVHPAATGTKSLSRRQLIDRCIGVGALLLAPGSAGAGHAMHGAPGASGHMDMSPTSGVVPDAVVPATDQALVEPETRRSADGMLSTTLRVGYAYRWIGGVRLYVRCYEGASPGPTLRVKPGDTLRIRLINDLPPNRDRLPADISQPHQFNNTNFHFHGAHASPSGIADNVMRSMAPGHSYDIEIKLPEDHTRGTYWYHPHHHGSADIQMSSGMVGAIVVEGDFADVPEIAAARERLLILTQVVFDASGMVEAFETLFPETATRFLAVNGQRRPTIAMRPGEVQRWRILNAAYQDDLLLDLEKHDLQVIAYDGIQLGAVQARKRVLIAPGQRADLLVRAGAAGTYALNAMPYDQGHPSPVGALARVVVSGTPMAMALPSALPPPPLETIRDSEITNRRTVTFSATAPEADAAGHWQEFGFFIDGKTFDPNRVDHRIKLGAVEEWTIVNTHEHDDHVFHIHTNPFQVVRVNGETLAVPEWRDSVIVDRKGGEVVFRSRFLDFTGVFMLHCHMMNHEEMGMMQTVEVYQP